MPHTRCKRCSRSPGAFEFAGIGSKGLRNCEVLDAESRSRNQELRKLEHTLKEEHDSQLAQLRTNLKEEHDSQLAQLKIFVHQVPETSFRR